MINNYRRDPYDVDILIRGHGNLDLTRQLLRSIRDNTDLNRVMVTYVDNGSECDEDGCADALGFGVENRSFTSVLLPFNHGSVRAINVGLALAFLSPAPYILLLDNDTEIPAGDVSWLDRFIAFFADDKVGAAGAVSDYVSGFQNCEAVIDLYAREWAVEGEGSGIKEPPDLPLLVSFAMMLRKKACLQIGAFDERFEPGMSEDYDYTLRLHEKGWKAVVANSVWIHHKGSQTFGAMGFHELLSTNYGKLLDKWGNDKLKEYGLEIRSKQ